MDISARLTALEAEIRNLRDMEDIRRLLATYAFNADMGRVDEYVAGWTDDGVYDVLETMKLEGKDALGGLLRDREGMHKKLLENRSQHLVANLFIKVEGDTAWAEGYSIVTAASEQTVKIFAAGYNHWDFVRGGKGWLMQRRIRRVIGGPTWGGDVVKNYLD